MLNSYFLQGSSSEQSLVQSLINEQLRMYGVEVYYLPRKYLTEKTIIKEVIASRFDDAYPIEIFMLKIMMDIQKVQLFYQNLEFKQQMKLL